MMRLPPFTYLAPRTVADAAQALASHGAAAMLVAGGTDLYPNMKRRQFEPTVLVGLLAIRELRGIRGSAREGITLGSCTTLSAVAAHAEIAAHYPALAAAAGLVSSPQLRRRGSFDFPVLGVAVAVRMEGDVVRDARIVVGAVASQPRPAPAAAAALVGGRLTPELIARVSGLAAGPAKPLDNTDFTHPYRKKMTRVFVARALASLAGLAPAGRPAEEVA